MKNKMTLLKEYLSGSLKDNWDSEAGKLLLTRYSYWSGLTFLICQMISLILTVLYGAGEIVLLLKCIGIAVGVWGLGMAASTSSDHNKWCVSIYSSSLFIIGLQIVMSLSKPLLNLE